MTVARMHSQRQVQRGRDAGRYPLQKRIDRGGDDPDAGGGGGTIPATGATAGTPGSYTPAGATVPSDVGGMSGITASPATAWTGGQYVPLSPSGSAYWNGTAWTLGVAP
jgi:hypothetical protein